MAYDCVTAALPLHALLCWETKLQAYFVPGSYEIRPLAGEGSIIPSLLRQMFYRSLPCWEATLDPGLDHWMPHMFLLSIGESGTGGGEVPFYELQSLMF